MCGIAGKISFSARRVLKQDLQKMCRAISHRGPDDEGLYISPDKKVGLGHRRLAIIDLSPAGHQPMEYLNRYWIVFNGEIYNFQEERTKLQKQGFEFKSQTDTEVIMALYHKYQEGCLKYLRGMFALAIYDQKEKILFCARDRVGKKPFKYYLDDKVFIFASELKAILTQKEYKRAPDFEAIHHYLTLQYVPAPWTGFLKIKKLPPAHWLKINLKAKKIIKKRYWRLDYSKKLNLSEQEWQERILAKLKESVQLRMMADVPLGAFLSGGVDSSAIVGIMSQLSPSPVKTFSIGFEEKKYSELKYARIIAKKFKTDHTEFMVKPDAIKILPMLVKQYEEPYADSSALPTYYVSQLTRKYVTVALNGDGGDENFAGYDRYSIQKISLWYERIRLLNQLVAEPLAKFLSQYIKNTLLERAYQFAQTLNQNYNHRYVNYLCYFNNQIKQKLYTDKFFQQVGAINSYDLLAKKFLEAKTPDKLDQTLYVDFTTYLPEDLLAKVDIATMAVALEGRSPFLDHKMLELTAQIPFNLKLKGLNNKKYILKKALGGFIPPEVMHRPKMGFGVPIEVWFRGQLKKYAYDQLLSRQAISRELFNKKTVKILLNTHYNTKINYANQIWALLTLELWLQEYFD